MRINNVETWSVLDEQNIGLYDFNTIDFDDLTGLLSVRTGIPTSFKMTVSSLDIIVECGQSTGST